MTPFVVNDDRRPMKIAAGGKLIQELFA